MSTCDNCDEKHDVEDIDACVKNLRDQLQWMRGERDELREAIRGVFRAIEGIR